MSNWPPVVDGVGTVLWIGALLAATALVLMLGIPWGIWWLVQHVRFA